ncbi:MAG: Zn-dependent protease [Clostridiaceae bacterium]|nr:Zn-dependent protease [Clostridiaceae bacterium]
MRQVLIYFAAILIHELFHVFAAQVLFREKIGIILLPSGFSGRWKSFQPEKWVQCAVCAFGPLGNILTAAAAKIFLFESYTKAEFIKANLFIGIFNLIPLYPMDGGSILLVFLYNKVGTDKTYGIMRKLGLGIRILLLTAGLYILVFYKNPSLFLAIILLPGLGTIKGTVKRLNLNSLIRRKERILKKRSYQMRDILLIKDVSLGEALLLLDYDKYHIIHIADENLKILGAVTEQQIIDAILQHNVGKTLEEVFIKKQ